MGYRDDPVWQALAAMRIAPYGAALTFTRRLARENGWSAQFARQVVEEYRRFLYLAATGAQPVTPSEQVDQAWHLHLAYTRHYWGVLCGEIIGRPLHHGPTAGGGAEGRKYRAQYAATLARYRDTFGEEPPVAIWPATDARFSGRYQWVDRSRHFVVPRRPFNILGLAGAATLLAACTALAATTAKPASADIDTFFIMMGIGALVFGGAFLFLIGFVLWHVIRRGVERTAGQPPSRRQQGRAQQRRRKRGDAESSGGSEYDPGGWGGGATGGAAAGGAAFMAGGGDFGGSGADGGWDSSDSGSDSSSSSSSDSGCSSSGCGGGGCGGGD